MSHFKLISSTKASDVIPVSKYVSEKTGLTIIIASVEGPLVNGFFCLATEAHDDDGLPHTLEHLIFLGSKRYPYKGILDLLANRCMAHGTNAWTDTDHTCYTIDTAGDVGMLTLLPIYIDHILQPTLTDEGFITEVHHIDGDGEDAGVVYCEMQGRENTADSRCELKLQRAMYPNNGYSAETGGIMKNLRESTNNEKVRDFHKKFYRPENLTIILTGQIEAKDVFDALKTVEDDIISKRNEEPQEEWVKPWQAIPPLPNCGQLKELWPADTEDCGQVYFGWRGPLLRDQDAMKSLTGCAVLLRYLCDTAAAPLQRQLVQREDALAGDVSYGLTENMAALIKIELNNVPINKLEEARDEALKCLKKVRDGDESLDMERVGRLVQKQLRESIASLESDPHHALAFRCIGDALYSLNESDFISRMNPQQTLTELMEEKVEYWQGLLQKYFTDDLVTVVGAPSIELQNTMAEEEKNRIEQQRAELGEGGLQEKGKQLQAAMEFNEQFQPMREQYWETWRQENSEQVAKLPTPDMDHGVNVGDLVMLRENGPPTYLCMGRIERIYTGTDGLPLFDIVTAYGMVRRSLHGLRNMDDYSNPGEGSNAQTKPVEGSNEQLKPEESSTKSVEGSNKQLKSGESSNVQTNPVEDSNEQLKPGESSDDQTKPIEDSNEQLKPEEGSTDQTKPECNSKVEPKSVDNNEIQTKSNNDRLDQSNREDSADSQVNPTIHNPIEQT